MSSIFTKIITGKIPSHKVYEDDRTYAFLDIYPVQPGHVLVVPKTEIDRFEDLGPDEYAALWNTVQNVAKRIKEQLNAPRVCLKVEGFDVPHAHVHVFPCRTAADFYTHADRSEEPDHEALAQMARKLAF